MKVLMLNGSANPVGCTNRALIEVGNTLKNEFGIDFEIFQITNKPIRDCIGCNKCTSEGCIFSKIDNDGVNDFISKIKQSDALVFASPVYYAHPSGRILSFLDRVFYSSDKKIFEGKPGAVVVSARRAGTSASLDVLYKYFGITNMPVISSSYWNMVHGMGKEDVEKDEEGLQTMRNLARNMAKYLLKRDDIKLESGHQTNFIH